MPSHEKANEYIHICSFNVYKLGSLDPKYTSIGEDDEEEESTRSCNGGCQRPEDTPSWK